MRRRVAADPESHCGGRITGARFKAKGCVAAIACGSALTELIVGKDAERGSRTTARGRQSPRSAACRKPQPTPPSWRSTHFRRRCSSDRKSLSSCLPRTRRAASPACNPARPSFLQPSANSIAWSRVRNIARMSFPKSRRNRATILADSWTANAEQIVAAEPDLVIASVPYQEKAVIEILKSGTSLSRASLRKILADIYARHRHYRRRGRRERSRRRSDRCACSSKSNESAPAPLESVVAQSLLRRMGQAADRVASLGRGTGGSRWEVKFLGTPGRQISAEEVARMDPDIVVAAWCGAGDRVPLEKIVAERNWQGTCAAHDLAGLLYSRRIPQYACSHASARSRCAGVCDSSRTVCRARKESGRLPVFHLPQPRICHSELRFSHARHHQN